MIERNYDEQMDFILEELIKEYENLYKGVNFYSGDHHQTTKDIVTEKVINKYGLKEWEINVLYYTLFINNNIKSIDPLTISLEGLVFRNNGGYLVKSKTKKQESERLERIQNDFKKYSFGLMVFTAIVALGTIVSGIYFAIEIIKYFK
jgi:hypothetical protein